ncbi:unnamed protein product, partial [marine sediment metagenome]
GRVSVICSDKTGTISKNEMTVERFWINSIEYQVTGSGYDSDGIIMESGKEVSLKENSSFQKFVDSSVVNNNAKLVYEDVKIRLKESKEMAIRKALGSPTEASLLVLAEKAGFTPFDVKNQYIIVTEFSFSSETKMMTTICKPKIDEGTIFAFSKGAPERILDISNQIEINGVIKPLTDNIKRTLTDDINNRAHQGYRTLAVGYKQIKDNKNFKREEVENNLVFLGYVSILDPPRPGVKAAVEESESAGIKIAMITGDHPATAKTIASQC